MGPQARQEYLVRMQERYRGASRAAKGRLLTEANPAPEWAQANDTVATERQPTYESVRAVLAQVPEVLDSEKDQNVDEADPYILAMAEEMRAVNDDARIVTEEFKTTVAKMDLGSAAGILGIPNVSIRAMLKAERIVEF